MTGKCDNGIPRKTWPRGNGTTAPGLNPAAAGLDQSYEARLGLPRHKRPGSRK